jgi:nitroreductase
MLEKGLSAKNKRPFFGEQYIEQIVQELAVFIEKNPIQHTAIQWPVAVLEKYFQECKGKPVIDRAAKTFSNLSLRNTKPNAIPYKSRTRPKTPITWNDLHTLAKRRRSVRTFLDTPVPLADIKRAMQVALQAPSACNRQSFRFHIVTDRDKANVISNIPGGASGYTVPAVIILIARYRGYHEERDILTPVIDASLAISHLLLALETMQLSSVCINWPQISKHHNRIAQYVEMAKDECVIMLLGIGYADPEGYIPYSDKKAIQEVLTHDKE